MALLALWLAVSPASAEVLCRKRQSVRLVLRAETCRPREHVVLPSELGIEQGETCVEAIGLAWRDVDALRAHFESARDLAARMEEQPWSGGEIWLAIEAVAIEQTLASLERRMDELGTPDVHTTIAHLWQLVTEEWATPLAACIEALEILPALEAALPTPPAA